MTLGKLLSISLSFAAIIWSCGGCGGSENSGNRGTGGTGGNGSTLPWASPFIEQGYTQAELIEQAIAARDEHAASVPAPIRDELTAHVAVALVSGSRASEADPVTFHPQTESEAWVMAGVSAIFQGSLPVASWCFANGVLADPGDERALNQLGWALLANERIDEARGVLLHAADLEPRLWSLWSNLGHAADVSGESERAIYYFGVGLEQHPESLNMHLRRGGLLLDRGDLVVASAHATHALAISPEDPEVVEFVEKVEDAGGSVFMPPLAPVLPSVPAGEGMRDVIRDYNECVSDATQRYSAAMIPVIEDVLEADQEHRFRMAEIQSRLPECEAGCEAAGAPDSCWDNCEASFCATGTVEVVANYLKHFHAASIDLSYSAAFRTRRRGCAYVAVETYEDSLSEDTIQDFILYVNVQCAVEAAGAVAGFLEDKAEIGERLPVITGCADAASLSEVELSLGYDLAGLGISTGIEACLDGFACVSFGETTFGFSVGLNVVSAGVDVDYVNPDVIFSVGTGYDVGVAAAGVSLKLSIVRGLGVSPSAKLGGVIRSTYSRDIWLLSF